MSKKAKEEVKEHIGKDGEVVEKTFSNYYWYYYKVPFFIILFLVVAIVVCTVQCATKENPDCYIVVYSDNYISDEVLNKMEDEFLKITKVKDTNKDGEVKVQYINCTYDPGDTTKKTQAHQRAMVQLQMDTAKYWILDDKGVDVYVKSDDIAVFEKHNGYTDIDGYGKSLKGTKVYKLLNSVGAKEKDYYLLEK